MKDCSFDLAIIGGGPAGTSAAISAAQSGVSVALLDGSDFPRQKVCGEFVSAESLELLRYLLREHSGAEKLFGDAPIVGRLRIFAAGRAVEAPVRPPGLSVPRFSLDLLLWESAQQSGVHVQSKREVLSLDGGGPFTLTTAQGKVSARSVILSAGRWSRFSDPSLMPSGPKWIGLKAHFSESNPSRSTDLYFFRYGYCGVQPVSENAVNVCAMVRSDVASTLEGVFGLEPRLARRAGGWKPLTSPVTTAPLVYRKPEALRGNVILAGDAAAFIDPFAGDGISLALRSGRTAAQSLSTFFTGRVSLQDAAREYQATYQREFAPLVAAAARIRSLPSLPEFAWPLAMQFLRIPGVMPYIVRKTRMG
jgi:flavin-dependent dehydrogenase